MKLNFKHKQTGFSLVEIIISMAVGTVLVGGVTSVYVDTIRNTADNISNIRLEQDLQSVVYLISQEMRRAGFDNDSVNGGDSDFGTITLNDANTCILYSYDMTIDGAGPDGDQDPDDKEKFGFRYIENDHVVKFGTAVTKCDGSDGTWYNINNPSVIPITAFTLNLVDDSLCVNLTTSTNCNSNDDPDAADNPYVVPVAGDKLLNKYQLNLDLAGHSVSDDSYTKSISSKIRLLNDILETQT